MIEIAVNVSATLLIPIPLSASSDTVTYEIFNSSGTVLASGSLTFVRDEVWKATYTPTALGIITLKANDTTLTSKRENFYSVVADEAEIEDEETTIPLSIETDLLLSIPGSASTDVVTYEIFDTSGTVIDSGSMEFVRDEIWKVSDFTGDDTGLIVLKGTDTTINSKRENFYKISSGFFGVINICNIALKHLGMLEIGSLEDQTPQARACTRYFNIARTATLASHRWSFATVVEALTEMDEDDVSVDEQPDWTVFYEFPDNALAVWNVFNEATTDDKEAQDFEVRYVPALAVKIICSDLDEAFVEYTYKVTDTTIYDNRFIDAFTYRLAALMAHDLTGDANMGIKFMQMFTAAINEAKRLDASHKRKKPPQSSGYVNSR